jgi:hypothetical protein
MNTNSPTPFTDVYVQLLDSLRSMIPGAGPAPAVAEKQAEVVAKQEWEEEGGNLKPAEAKAVKPAKMKGAPKLLSKRKKTAPKPAAKRVRARR